MNSEHSLFNTIITFSLFNMSTTIGENINYFMYKYNIAMSDWYNSFSYIDKKIDVYVNRKVDINVKYNAHAIQDLCEMRDLHNGSNDSRLHVVEPPRGRSFIWQIGVNSSIQDRRQVDRGFLWSRVSCTRQR